MKIYAYTFPRYKKENEKYYIKIGCTTKDVNTRIWQQITASNTEDFELLYKSHEVSFTDHKIHAILEKYGEHRPKLRKEWFITDIDTIKRAVNEAEGLSYRPNSFKMRKSQQEAVDKAYDYFMTNGDDIYLWNAKMRFGKTFCAYKLMKKIEANKTLILTYKPSTVTEWENELNNHIDFEGYNFIKALDAKNEISLSNGDVLFVSFQDVLQDFDIDEEDPNRKNNLSIKPKFKKLFDESFDLVIIDEVHFGATNYPAQEFLKNINYITTLYLSGTPFKIINRGDLSEEQVFNWTYIDEQNEKRRLLEKGFNSNNNLDKKFNPYLSLPKMTIIGYEVGKKAFKDVKYYYDEEKFNFAKFFNSKDGKVFEHQQAVDHFLDQISDKKSNTSPFFAKDIKDLKHTFWLLPNVNSAHALYHTLKKHQFFKKYNIIPASGNNLGKGLDTLRLVKNTITGDKNTITLSCGKLTTGVTVKEWNAIFLLTNTNSIETYFQSIFRAQSPDTKNDKNDCYVFDFDSDRMLKMIYNYSKEHSKNQSIKENIKEMLATMNLLCYTDNNFINLEVNDILDMAIYGIGGTILQKKFESRNLLNVNIINNLKYDNNLINILKYIKIFRKISVKKDEFEITSGLGKGKNFCITGKSYNEDKKVRDKTNERIKQVLQRLLTRLPIFMYLSEYVEETIEDVIEKFEPILFEEVTGIKVEAFKELKNAGIFNVENLNEAVRAFKIYEHSSIINNLPMTTDILDVMANLSNEEVFTPVTIVNEVLDTLPIEIWSDPNLKWFNPAVKNGIWLREVYKRLFKGLKNLIINLKDREHYIKKYMLYGYTTSNVAWMMACKTMYAWVDSIDDKYIRWKNSPYIGNIENKRFLETEMKDMPKFDLVIGNPPYQENDGGGGQGTSASPIYNLYIKKIIDKINPKYFSFIIPSRWFAGGKGLDSFRKEMQKDKHIKIIKDYPNAQKIFPSVDIKGGVCYFLREREYDGPCIFNDWKNKLDKYPIIVRNEEVVGIIDKICKHKSFSCLKNKVLPRKPFNLRSDINKNIEEHKKGIPCYCAGKIIFYIDPNKDYGTTGKFVDKYKIIDKWKVFSSKAQTHEYQNKPVVFLGQPGEICSESYLVLNYFDSEIEAKNFKTFVETHFFEFMLKIMVITQNISANKYTFVPDQLDYTKEYTDEYLYKKYGLTEEEVAFIESKFK